VVEVEDLPPSALDGVPGPRLSESPGCLTRSRSADPRTLRDRVHTFYEAGIGTHASGQLGTYG